MQNGIINNNTKDSTCLYIKFLVAINGVRMVRYIKAKRKHKDKGEQSMLQDTKANKPDIAVEVFLSLVRIFLIVLVIINAIWAGIFIHYINKSITDVSHNIEMTQDGQDNNQSITNG